MLTYAIWKFPLPTRNKFTLELPEHARFLSCQDQSGLGPCSWWLVDKNGFKQLRKFRIFMTGEDIASISTLTYLGTFQTSDFVGHLFEEAHYVGGNPP